MVQYQGVQKASVYLRIIEVKEFFLSSKIFHCLSTFLRFFPILTHNVFYTFHIKPFLLFSLKYIFKPPRYLHLPFKVYDPASIS